MMHLDVCQWTYVYVLLGAECVASCEQSHVFVRIHLV